MTLKKDSLLLRIITYNGIAIILVSTIMALLFGIVTVNEINARLLDRSKEEITALSRTYISLVEKSEKDLFNSIADSVSLISIKNEDEEFYKSRLAEIIKNQLNLKSYSKYNKSYIQIISNNRELIGESGYKDIKYDIIGNSELVPHMGILETKSHYFIGTDKNIYVRIIQPYRLVKSFEKYYVILTFPISNYSLSNIRKYIEIKKEDKIFVLSKDKYIFGELENIEKLNFFKLNYKKKKYLNLKDYNYYFIEKKIEKEPYYIALTSLYDDEDNVIGNMGIAMSKKNFLAIKYMLATMILAISLLSVVVSTALCSRIFMKLLHPLSILAEKTKNIETNSDKLELDEENIYEIRTIKNSIKAMKDRLSENQILLLNKNEKLKTNLNRIIAVENVLMGVDMDGNFSESLEKILRALTSERGFGYSRAIYFDYKEDENLLSAEKISVNPQISLNIGKYTKGIGGFAFQIKDLENLLPLLKIKHEQGNLLSDSLDSGKIIYFNEKGYKFNFGNELFKSLGFSNFLILPISDKNVKIGAILLDYFEKDRIISKEEVEVMTLLIMNLLIRVKNNLQEERKIISERTITMTKIYHKFLKNNENLIKKLESFIEKIRDREYNDKDIDIIKSCILDKKSENNALKNMLTDSDEVMEKLNIENILIGVIKDFENDSKKYNIDISIFSNFHGYIYGNKMKIYQMFIEIFKNSIQAILIRNKLDKKINITLSGDINKRVSIEISDNGIGMEKNQLNQINQFKKPYSSEKRDLLGLGLTLVHNIIKEHQGSIKIFSELDEGTTIKIIFNEYREENNI